MKLNFGCFLSILLIFVSDSILSQIIITDRPDQTESPVTLEKGRLQIESGILLQVDGGGNEELKSLLIPTNLFRFGISKKVELRLVLQLEGLQVFNDNAYHYALGNIELGTKIVLNQKENPKVQFAILSHLKLPKDNKDQLGFLNRISIAHRIGQNTSLGYNFGYNHFHQGDGNFIYTIAIGQSLTEKLSIYIEPYGSVYTANAPFSNFDYGLAYLINSNLQVDLSFGLGLNNTMSYQSLGISWRQKAKEKNSTNP